MPIRPATPSDEPDMASVLATSFFNEALFGGTIHPHRHEYPDDVKIFFSERLRKAWDTPRERLLVATTNTDGKEKIVGAAIWERQGDDAGAKKVEAEWERIGPEVFRPLPAQNRALDPSKRNILEDAAPHTGHYWDGPRAQNWYLSVCGVHPDCAGKGFGRELVHWGLDRARKEHVHASVIASEGNDKFYLRCGYDEVVGNATEGEKNPLNGVAGGDILFMYPKEMSSASS